VPDYLSSNIFGSSPDVQAVFDGNNNKGWLNTDSNCKFGITLTPKYVGKLTEVKYFMNRFNKGTFWNKASNTSYLAFEGSNDGAAWTPIFTVKSEIHEGWNYYNDAALFSTSYN
jgi:hypothetical protein